MAETLTANLQRRLESLVREDPDRRLQFIVTLRTGASSARVASEGMTIDQQIPEPPLLLGAMTPKQALAVARLDTVARVEEDTGGVHALSTPPKLFQNLIARKGIRPFKRSGVTTAISHCRPSHHRVHRAVRDRLRASFL